MEPSSFGCLLAPHFCDNVHPAMPVASVAALRKTPVDAGNHRSKEKLSGVLNRDLRQYSCDTPYGAIETVA